MRKIYTLITLSVLLLAVSCKTASKLYDKGNYDEAVQLAVKKLQKKPDAEMKALLQRAYQYAVNDHEDRIRQHSESTNDLKWEWIHADYLSLQRLYEAIHSSPEALSVVTPTDYSSYLHTYADKAADTRFQRGMMWMSARTTGSDGDKNDKLSFRNAYHEFVAALQYRPGELSFIQRRDEAYQSAVINVVIMPLEGNSYRFSAYNNYDVADLESNLLRQLQYNSGNEFVKFYNSWEAGSYNIQPDQFIDFHFTSFDFDRTRDERKTREVSKNIVVKETVHRPDSVVKEYKKVYAKITTTERRMVSKGNLRINIRDASGRWLWSDDVRGDHRWYTDFSTFTGDERALSEEDKKLINHREAYPPHQDEIARCIINEITDDMPGRLRNYFSRL